MTDPEDSGPRRQEQESRAPVAVTTSGSRRRLVVLACAIAVGVLIIDQVTKWVVVRTLTGREPIGLIGDWLELRLIRNSGAAFSMGEGLTVALAVLACVAIVLIAVLGLPRLRWRSWAVVAGLALGGIGGNLIDRLFRSPGVLRGHVVDFISVKYFAIFNVADMALTSAAILVIVVELVLAARARRGDAAGPAAE